ATLIGLSAFTARAMQTVEVDWDPETLTLTLTPDDTGSGLIEPTISLINGFPIGIGAEVPYGWITEHPLVRVGILPQYVQGWNTPSVRINGGPELYRQAFWVDIPVRQIPDGGATV